MPPSRATLAFVLCACALSVATAVRAEAVSLLGPASVFAPGRALIPVRGTPLIDSRPRRGSSLFSDRAGKSLFAPYAARALRAPAQVAPAGAPLSGSRIERLRQLIGHAESRRDGYDAVQHGARIKPPKTPTAMTIGEIFAWIDATPGQPHAIGRYQFIPATLKRLVKRLGIDERQSFSSQVQDRLADELLAEAGLDDITAGRIGRQRFMENMAKVWAGLPTSDGKSHYDGFAGNKATMTWADYDAQMRRLFPG